jgi:hypothetical protein
MEALSTPCPTLRPPARRGFYALCGESQSLDVFDLKIVYYF